MFTKLYLTINHADGFLHLTRIVKMSGVGMGCPIVIHSQDGTSHHTTKVEWLRCDVDNELMELGLEQININKGYHELISSGEFAMWQIETS